MNYEEKYKHALERAMKLVIDGYLDTITVDNIFPELKESEDERIRKAIITFIKKRDRSGCDYDYDQWISWLEKQGDTFTKKDIDDAYLQGICDARHEIEKQGEQKPADKVEPKFKVGDWVVNSTTLNLCHILKVEHGQYICDDCSFPITKENEYHLWTINDAKDGDVLVAKDGHPFIFTGEFDAQDDNPTAYCGINSDDKFITCKGSHWTFKDGIKPATKEQRELLFSKMRESGYEWDAEKKELKKIEDKTLDADKVIEWLDEHVPTKFEDMANYVQQFKQDFGL